MIKRKVRWVAPNGNERLRHFCLSDENDAERFKALIVKLVQTNTLYTIEYC